MERKGAVLDNNSSGVTSVVLGILSIVFGFTVFVGSIAGFLLGIIGVFFALSQIKLNKNKWSTAGLILGILGTLFNLAVIALLISLLFQVMRQIQASGLLG